MEVKPGDRVEMKKPHPAAARRLRSCELAWILRYAV